ncbi:hypothetical protein BT93_K1119 [Corymbia citriodora subsp. variegata]|nr:hypothetical protein BT93_K1119 [Corymbia citriodora subsp. variegata]
MALQVLKLIFTAFTVAFLSARLRSKLWEQGIRGPPGSFLIGNLREIKKHQSQSTTPSKSPSQEDQQAITHNCSSKLFPYLDRWNLREIKKHQLIMGNHKVNGSVFMFSMGNLQMLCVYDVEAVREISTCTSLDFGKPSYQLKAMGPLLGQGILTSNGAKWAHQRKILAPELFADKVKGMINLMAESSITLVNSWSEKIEKEGGIAEINIDSHMRSFSGDDEIFLKLRALQEAISKIALTSAIPGFRYLPTKSNREIWKLEREIQSLILKVVKERKEATSEKDLLEMILEEAKNSSELGHGDATDRFVMDNCKNIYLAGYETTAVAASWTLMLLASNPRWQAKVREEVMELLRGGQIPDADIIRKMKTLTMVINESLRLYPPVAIISREALEDMKFGNIRVPKGVNVWTVMVTLHQDHNIWGPNANRFDLERFANGVTRACQLPYAYMPFGVGPRTCLGQNFAMAELKVLLALVISNFSFSISPKYRHSPAMRLVIEPEFGVDLLVRRF